VTVAGAPPAARRLVKTFVRREGRLTQAQESAIEQHFPQWGVYPPAPGARLDMEALFGRRAPVWLDIGFGAGDALLELALVHPDCDHLGVEVHRPGVGRVLGAVAAGGPGNIRVACHDAIEVLRDWLPEASLAGLRLYFPDPWPKKRHHKRRMVQPDWAELVVRRLQSGGVLHVATDWEHYARQILLVLDAAPDLVNLQGRGAYAPDRGDRPLTRFERRGLDLGHRVFDLVYQRV
jgi:tRNA (guanine-N7-)-methyltransferase